MQITEIGNDNDIMDWHWAEWTVNDASTTSFSPPPCRRSPLALDAIITNGVSWLFLRQSV